MFRDADNDLGFWVAVSPVSLPWNGASLYVAPDGTNFIAVGELGVGATMGACGSPLGNFQGGNIVDELNSVRVTMFNGGTLTSITTDAILAGFNLCLIGDEILCFRTATLNLDGTYTLTGFLRGRRGTEFSIGGHADSERFILFDPAKWLRVPQTVADLSVSKTYKTVTFGRTLATTPPKTFVNVGAPLKPYSPCHLGAGIDPSGNWTIQWTRRTRLQGDWRDGVDVPLNEETEAYEVDIFTSGFIAQKRTIAVSGGPSATYTAAQQLADFGSLQTTLNVQVYQLSAVVGRGYAAKAILTS